MALLTNEWHKAIGEKWYGREVLVEFSDGHKEVATWKGYYWVDQANQRVCETCERYITKFYIFEKDYEKD